MIYGGEGEGYFVVIVFFVIVGSNLEKIDLLKERIKKIKVEL